MMFIIKLGWRILKKCVFSWQKPLGLYGVFLAPFIICEITLIVGGNSACIVVSKVCNWEIWSQLRE